MERVLILGSGGAGKSTLARRLGERTGLPVIHLDRIWWRPGWVNCSREEFDRRLERELAGDRWIVDGNYGRTLERRLARADTVIFLDYPVRTCLWGALRRMLRYRGKSRPDMTEGCLERMDPEFVLWILEFRRKTRPQVLNLLSEWGGTAHVFPDRRTCEMWLSTLPCEDMEKTAGE